METVRRYIIALLDQSEFLEHLSVKRIELALVCGLLSNITRFPLSNIIHELKQRKSGFLPILSEENILENVLSVKNKRGETIPDIIDDTFYQFDHQLMRNILLDRKQALEPEDHLIYSFINCSLDARVIDFVRRDSLHLGLMKGDSFDLDELLPHFTIYHHRLALRSTGVTIAEQVIAMRYWLFNRIYWNWPNRAFCSMVRHVIMPLGENDVFLQQVPERILFSTEDDLLSFLEKICKDLKRTDLSEIMRFLAKPDQVLFRLALDVSPKEHLDLKSVCKKVANMDYEQLEQLAHNVANNVNSIKKHRRNNEDRTLVIVDMPYEPGARKLVVCPINS